MNPELQQAVTILLVGMSTVFFILLLVVISARVIIALTNRFTVNEEIRIQGRTVRAASPRSHLPSHHQKVIHLSVQQLSGGLGVIEHIEKLGKTE